MAVFRISFFSSFFFRLMKTAGESLCETEDGIPIFFDINFAFDIDNFAHFAT